MEPSDFIIGCDMDDTLTHLVTPWIQYLNNRYGTHVDPYKELHWDMKVQYPDLTYEQIFEPLFEKEFWKHVVPLPGAVNVVKRLIDEGFQFYIVTSTHYRSLADKLPDVLFRYFPFIDRHNVIITYNKQLINCHVLIDDGTHNIVGPYRGLLMDAQHNKSFKETDFDNVKRIYSWAEAYEEVHKIYNQYKESIYDDTADLSSASASVSVA